MYCDLNDSQMSLSSSQDSVDSALPQKGFEILKDAAAVDKEAELSFVVPYSGHKKLGGITIGDYDFSKNKLNYGLGGSWTLSLSCRFSRQGKDDSGNQKKVFCAKASIKGNESSDTVVIKHSPPSVHRCKQAFVDGGGKVIQVYFIFCFYYLFVKLNYTILP